MSASTSPTDAGRLEARYPVLAELSAPARTRLLQSAHWMHVPAGAMLFDDHQACEGFPFVVEGSVRVSKCAPSGRELPLYRVGPARPASSPRPACSATRTTTRAASPSPTPC